MTRITSWVLGAGIALASICAAHAADTVAGAWKMTVGVNDAPCTLTLTPDDSGAAGTIAAGSDCPSGLDTVATFKAVGAGLQLYAGTGDIVAWLKPQGDSFVGTRLTDGRKLALSR